MAWARKLPSGKWQGYYRAPDRRVRRASEHGTFLRKKDAEDTARAQERKVSRGEWTDPELASIAVEDLAEQWFEGARPMLQPKTVASYESLLRSRILPTFGSRQVGTSAFGCHHLGRGMVADGLSPSRTRQAHVVLRLLFDSAVRDGYLTRNPAMGVKLPRLEHTEASFFEPQVVDALVDALEAPYDLLTAVMGVCGLRWGEAVALRRCHADLLRRRLRVEESLAEVSGHFMWGPTKSHARRSVPLSPGLIAGISSHLERLDTGPRTLLFTGPKGGPLRYRYFLMKPWREALASLGLPAVGVHVLRHSAAARMIAAGGSAKTLQTVLGHRSAAFC